MIPINIQATGTIELFTLKGDGPDDVKISLRNEIPMNLDPAVRDQMMNVQFGIFYMFMNDEAGLAEAGSIFRAGMEFGMRHMNQPPPPDDRGPRKPKPTKPDPDGELMKPIKKLEEIMKKK